MNKYANLVGTNKIKDEYTKINIGFDRVEADINKLETDVTAVNTRVDTIITTPISGQAATQEIVDARVSAVKSKTFASLDARFEETEQDIATHMADTVTDADGVHGFKIEYGTFTPTLSNGTTEVSAYDVAYCGLLSQTKRCGVFRLVRKSNDNWRCNRKFAYWRFSICNKRRNILRPNIYYRVGEFKLWNRYDRI